MGGEIGVTSKKGEGSAFWFTFQLKTIKDDTAIAKPANKELKVVPQKVLLVTNSDVFGASLVKRIASEQGLSPTVIAFADVAEFTSHRRAPSNCFDIILCDASSQFDLPLYQDAISDLRQFSGSDSVRCGLLVSLRQKFSEEILSLDGVDFAIAKPIPRLAIQRMLSYDTEFWLDRTDDYDGPDRL